MNIKNNPFSSIEQITDQFLKTKSENDKKVAVENKVSFQEIFSSQQKLKQESIVKFSKHANDRLLSRNIDMTQSQMQRLEKGLDKAREKGMNESLVMVDDLAFIVNIKNKTVVTAVSDTKEAVFTNIDGAVII